jgi:hypothetical protein
MEGTPEGSGEPGRRLSLGWVLLAVVFAAYLLFRVAQGVAWLVHHL